MTKAQGQPDDALRTLHEYSIIPAARELWLCGNPDSPSAKEDADEEPGVEFSMADRFLKGLRFLVLADDTAPILVHMNSYGGDVYQGMALYDAIRFCPAPVTILNYAGARSMSAVILQAADWRVMLPDSYFMFHMGSTGIKGDAQRVYSQMAFERRYDRLVIDIWGAAMKSCPHGQFRKRSLEWIRKMLKARMREETDVFLTPAEAVDWGLADEVFAGDWPGLKKF